MRRSNRVNGDLGPPLKWAGGKRWLLPRLRPLWEPYRHMRLCEPFCGGLAVALGLRPKKALLNDVNPHAVHFYLRLQQGLSIKLPMRNEQDLYYQYRDDFNRLITGRQAESKKAAAIFYYLNRTGYNGLCRFNSRGEFNVPFGRYKTINYLRDFTPYKEVLSAWQFTNDDFEDIQVEPDGFIYADPPYDVEFRHYAKDGFDWPDQERLAHWLSRHPGPVVASNQATERILELYGDLGFRLVLLDAPRMINCTGDRSPAKEMLALRGMDFAGVFPVTG